MLHLDVPAAVRLSPTTETLQSLPAGRALLLDNEPIALAAPWRPDLRILDFHLDGGHAGLNAWRQWRAHHAGVSTVMLMADRELHQLLRDAGISVLYKPLKPLALRQMLQRIAAGAR